MDKTGMLEVYAEQVYAGSMTQDEGVRRSFAQVKKSSRGASESGAAAGGEVLFAFRLNTEDSKIVTQAIEKAMKDYSIDKNRALVKIARNYLEALGV